MLCIGATGELLEWEGVGGNAEKEIEAVVRVVTSEPWRLSSEGGRIEAAEPCGGVEVVARLASGMF